MRLRLEDKLLTINGILDAAAQGPVGQLVKIAKQLCLPGIPEFRICAANVCNRKDIQVVEMQRIADDRCELIDHVRIAEVFFLCGHRQDQVMAH